jgi:hypothetical protein
MVQDNIIHVMVMTFHMCTYLGMNILVYKKKHKKCQNGLKSAQRVFLHNISCTWDLHLKLEFFESNEYKK